MKQGLKKSKSGLIMVVVSFLVGMSLFFSACYPNNPAPYPSGPISVTGGHNGGIGSGPPGSSSNYVVGAVGYTVDSTAGFPVTTYLLAAAVAVNKNPVSNAAVTFTDPNGTNQYSLAYAGSNQTIGGVTCGIYQDVPSSFSTIGVFNLKVETTFGASAASVTAFNSVVSFPSPYTTLSWSGSSPSNAVAVVSVATPSVSYSQSGTASPISIPSSTYISGVTYIYSFVQTNQATTINGGTGSIGYLQTTNGTFVAP